MKALAFALLIVGGTLATTIPALAIDNVMPEPVTDYMPPVTTDDALPTSAAQDTELPAAQADAPAATEARANAPVPYAPASAADNAVPVPAQAAAKRYDSVEVIKKIREISRSRGVHTAEIAPDYAPPRRDVGSGYRIRSDVTLVNFVVHRYRVIYGPELAPTSDAGEYRPVYGPRRPHRSACTYGRRGHYGSCRPLLHVRG